jgi:nucleotide sugar dehydrogenase
MYKFVNIIGYGYVGSGMGYLCKKNDVSFCTYDLVAKSESCALNNFDSLSAMVINSEKENDVNVYFVCVPTPNKENGECDVSIIKCVLKELSEACTKETLVIIKSTVEPGCCGSLSDEFVDLRVVFCPEFLREKTFEDDIYYAKFVLLGHHTSHPEETKCLAEAVMKDLYKHNMDIEVISASYEECELFKYTINVFLSVKVWFFNEVHGLSDKLGIDYSKLKDLFRLDDRIGESHTGVPGHDGKYGFGGKCLPKETKAMRYLQQKLGLDDKVLSEILRRNAEMREKK